ncbi:hypothetical protein FALBO_16336 [Fusarium albosuccineum]|uniref:Uncharacterized protein n=1 Tax=Fusarium albosuccineum TaxID=1237068 RepID=A0A8H4KLD5_9HYPO|nr:hypothetical protein FALBO_16336 [Fusarium albosuccineum]
MELAHLQPHEDEVLIALDISHGQSLVQTFPPANGQTLGRGRHRDWQSSFSVLQSQASLNNGETKQEPDQNSIRKSSLKTNMSPSLVEYGVSENPQVFATRPNRRFSIG